jgi:hypothetical protein
MFLARRPSAGVIDHFLRQSHLRAASRPRAALAWLGTPVVRLLQVRFRRDSLAAMARVAR